MNMYYTGIGSRQTPKNVLEDMDKIAKYLAAIGYTLRSGGAAGADETFEESVLLADGKAEIYLPWNGFRSRSPAPYAPHYLSLDTMDKKIVSEAMNIASEYHPAWNYLSLAAARLHTRNTFQVLGEDLKTPSKFVVCWTTPKGGTTQALRIAESYKIPIFNLINPDAISALKEWLRSNPAALS